MTIGALPASADIIYDDFDDGVLDAAWNISFNNVSDWTYVETGSELVVTDIVPLEYNKWATVTLTQDCDPLSDFWVDFNFSWDSEGRRSAVQQIILSLFGDNGERVASVGYVDNGISSRGSQYAEIGSNDFISDEYTVPLNGFAAADIVRQDGNIDILWDGDSLLTGESNTLFSYVTLEFSYIAQNTGYPSYTGSIFGTESVDLIADPPPEPPVPTPEPGTMLLLGLGLLGIFIGRKLYSEKL
jgi:hypothetical protein